LAIPDQLLDAEVLGDLLMVWQRAQLHQIELHRIVDQAVDEQPVVHESAREQRHVLRRIRVLAVVSKVGREVVLAVLTGRSVQVLEQDDRG